MLGSSGSKSDMSSGCQVGRNTGTEPQCACAECSAIANA